MNRYARTAILLSAAVLVLVPFLILTARAFSTSWVYPDLLPNLNPGTFFDYVDSDRFREPLVRSIILSALVTLVSMVIGFLPAKYFGTRSFRGKTLLYIFLLIPAVTPGICIMFGLIEVLIDLGIYRKYLSLVLCQAAFTTPYFIFVMIPVFKRYDTNLEYQSSVLGVGTLSTLLNVTIPAVKSGLASSLMLTFVISWSMYLITSVAAPMGFETMATMLLPQLSFGYAMDTHVAITAFVFLIPALISVMISTGFINRDKSNSRSDNQ